MKKHLLIAAMAICAMATPAPAQERANPLDLTFAENLETPKLGAKGLADIKAHLLDLKNSLTRNGIDADLDRNGEIIVATIPCSALFAPNSTELKPAGKKTLATFQSFVKHPTMYKLVVAVHSDNSGDDEYSDALTAARADCVEAFLTSIPDRPAVCNVVPFGLGQDDPLNDNGSMKKREANRRVEIYVVPEWQMEQMARSGKLKKK